MENNNIVVRLARKIGIDGAIAYSSGARIIQGVAGVGSVFFISTFLTDVEQGFYFTFGSILALQIFFELGLTGIMTQYVAHEASHLELRDDNTYIGDKRYLSRLASLIRFCVKWYSVLAIIVLIFLIIVGFAYFSRYGDSQAKDVSWRLPWVLVSFATAIQLFISPFNSILNGLGFIKNVTKISFFQQIILPLSIWVGLMGGAKLFVSGIGYLLSSLVWIFMVYKGNLFAKLLSFAKIEINERISYVKEILPYQWKIALSWVSGYFIFQMFNPVLFATEGAVVAGQMGMTLTAISAIQGLSTSWLSTKVPLFSSLIAQKKYNELDIISNKTMKQMTTVCLVLFVFFYICLYVIKILKIEFNGSLLSERFLFSIPLIMLMLAAYVNQFVNVWATYLRCHKVEPLLWQSLVMAILVSLSTLIGGKYGGLYAITIGYCVLTVFVGAPWAYCIYKNKKKIWHGEY